MTTIVNPSQGAGADSLQTAGAIAHGGGSETGFVYDSATSPSPVAQAEGTITEANLNNFAQTSSGASLNVDIDAGEAFVYGAWTVVDTSPADTVTLAASTSNQTVYVGWDDTVGDTVIIGLDGEFASTDQRIPLYDFDTDGSGVTSVTDRRAIGKEISVDSKLELPQVSDTTNATGQSERNVVYVDGGGSEEQGLYFYNGASYERTGTSQTTIEGDALAYDFVTGGL